MKCPYCDKEMDKGYIQSYRWDVSWTPENKDAHKFRNRLYSYEILLKKVGHNHINRLTVYRCADCKKEIIDENDL